MELPGVLELTVALVVMFVGATIFSTVGFGIGLSTIPFLLLVLDPQTVVVTINTVAPLLFLLIIWQTRRELAVREMAPIALAGLAGVPLGVALLGLVGASTLRIAIATLVLIVATLVALNLPRTIPRTVLAGPAAGFLGGVFINATGIGGPIVVLYLIARGWTSHAIRGSLSLYFLVIGLAGISGYAATGLYTAERVSLVLAVIAPVLLGYFLASLFLRRMDEALFRRAVLLVIVTTSASLLIREVLRLW